MATRNDELRKRQNNRIEYEDEKESSQKTLDLYDKEENKE